MIPTGLLPYWLLLVTPTDPSLFTPESCLSTRFYGNYGPNSVFVTTLPCYTEFINQSLYAEESSLVVPASEIEQLVWMEYKAIEPSLAVAELQPNAEFDAFLARVRDLSASPAPVVAPEGQQVFGEQLSELLDSGAEVMLTGGRDAMDDSVQWALLSVSPEVGRSIDTILPRFWKSKLLPTSPIAPFIPVPKESVSYIKDVLNTLKFDPEIASIVGNISVPLMHKDIMWLTGEDGESGIVSRHSFAQGSRTAADWLKTQFEETGATCELKPFLFGYAPNVICRYEGSSNTTGTALLSAHYDSRGSFGSTRAPGGDDDGSGTTALLAIARTIKRKGITFHDNVELCAFAGEEQGLLGSRAYSRELRAADANLTLMIQADMLAYHAEGEPAQLGLPDVIGTPEVAQLVANVSAIYSPELKVGITAACCSDHQSFHEQGFAATQVFERAGPIADPMYHNSGDLSVRPNYDLEQVKSIAKVQFATLLHTVGYDLE